MHRVHAFLYQNHIILRYNTLINITTLAMFFMVVTPHFFDIIFGLTIKKVFCFQVGQTSQIYRDVLKMFKHDNTRIFFWRETPPQQQCLHCNSMSRVHWTYSSIIHWDIFFYSFVVWLQRLIVFMIIYWMPRVISWFWVQRYLKYLPSLVTLNKLH